MLGKIQNLSVAKWYDPFISVGIVLGSFFYLRFSSLSNTEIILVIVFFTTVYMFLIESLRSSWLKKGFEYNADKRTVKEIFKTSLIKYVGVLFGITLMFFMYWLIPEYQNLKYLNPINEARYMFLILFLPVSFLLIFITEYILGNKEDGTYQMGKFVLLKLDSIDWVKFKDGLFEWLIRLVFLTLNFTSCVSLVNNFREPSDLLFNRGFGWAVITIESFILLVIMLTILPGYLFSSRLINTHVKKIDTTWFAWTVTLICYQPFIQPIFGNILKYGPPTSVHNGLAVWISVTQSIPPIFYFVGGSIVFFALIHLWAEAILGIRSSNLTNRGIITNGPFSFTKHPVYVSKCFGWAFISLPFLNHLTFLDSFRLGLLFLGVCMIYVGRSLAEERVLATDELYVKYALLMDEKGMFAFVGRLVPCMSFAWRLKYWEKKGYIIKSNQ